MMTSSHLHDAYESLKAEATRLAGGLTDLAQRATAYHHLFRASGGNHAFPLIAAHGALWAGGYFRFGMRLGKWLTLQYAFSPEVRRTKLRQLNDFANAFRDINRRVCVDTFTNFHFTARFGNHPDAEMFVPATLLAALNRLHAAVARGYELSDAEKREIFEAHFLHEQEHVVGPAITKTVMTFEWPVLRFLALRPVIRFAYFPGRRVFWFRNFASRDERVSKGQMAFEVAAEAGWSQVEKTLACYRVLPEAFFAGPIEYFAALRSALRRPLELNLHTAAAQVDA